MLPNWVAFYPIVSSIVTGNLVYISVEMFIKQFRLLMYNKHTWGTGD